VVCDELLQSCAEFIVMCILREVELLQIITLVLSVLVSCYCRLLSLLICYVTDVVSLLYIDVIMIYTLDTVFCQWTGQCLCCMAIVSILVNVSVLVSVIGLISVCVVPVSVSGLIISFS